MDRFRVALTFDTEHPDRPTQPRVTEGLLDALEAEAVPATFFLQGRWVEAYPDTAARIAPAGHLVASHSFYHARMPLFSPTGFADDVRAAERVIERVTGVDPRPWFRCPFGTGGDDPEMLARLADLGYREVGWNVDGHDWAEREADPLVTRVVKETLAHGDGAVVLLHGWPQSTLGGLPAIIKSLRAEGAGFVRVDELDQIPTEHVSVSDPTA